MYSCSLWKRCIDTSGSYRFFHLNSLKDWFDTQIIQYVADETAFTQFRLYVVLDLFMQCWEFSLVDAVLKMMSRMITNVEKHEVEQFPRKVSRVIVLTAHLTMGML